MRSTIFTIIGFAMVWFCAPVLQAERAAGSPGVVPGLALWLKADAIVAGAPEKTGARSPNADLELWLKPAAGTADSGTRVTKWKDSSPAGNHLAAQESSAPILASEYGRPTVFFNGKSRMEAPEFRMGDTAGMTIFVVGNHDPGQSKDVGFPYLLSFTRETPYFPGSVRASRGASGMSGTSIGIYFPGAEMKRDVDWSTPGLKILSATLDPAARRHRLLSNGEQVASGDADISKEFQQFAKPIHLILGCMFGWGKYNGYWQGHVAELLIYNRALSDSERQMVEVYLSAKYAADQKYMTPLAPKLPFAYYPSRNELEVAVDASMALASCSEDKRREALSGLKAVAVAILPVEGGRAAATGTVPVDASGRGQAVVRLPDLPDGEYLVEYSIGNTIIRSPKTFKRIHFPWEGNSMGLEHEVLSPFQPIEVKGCSVRIVGREYVMNGFGLFDSVKALGRELLAGPMRLVYETGEGQGKWNDLQVRGKAVHPDLAVFDGQALADAVTVKVSSSIEEDGCMKVSMTLAPGRSPKEITRMWLEIPLKDAEVPLCHFVGQGLRNYYGGSTPRGGKIVWDVINQIGAPAIWRAEPGPEDGEIWNSKQFKTWPSYPVNMRAFMPYVWLGAEERGIAWFGENARGYVEQFGSPSQTISREGGRVLLRIHLIQRPITLAGPRQIEFGLQASPAKPMPSEWRYQRTPVGWESVTPWGGYACCSKYPDNRDFSMIDKLVEAGRTGALDRKFFEAKDSQRSQPERQVQGNNPWLKQMLWLGDLLTNSYNSNGKTPAPVATYFEEHNTDQGYPEWQVFMDEWCDREFNRFQSTQSSWGAFPRSYQDFAVYYASEYLRRGVGIYLDNCYLKFNWNPAFSAAYAGGDGVLRPAATLWDMRAYYKRLWRMTQRWNSKGIAPYPLHMYQHMTNTRIIPLSTWSTMTLDQEQNYRDYKKDNPEKSSPWPPDYLRAVTVGRQTGSIPTSLHALRNTDLNKVSDRSKLANWGMHAVHEAYMYSGMGGEGTLAPKYQAVLRQFGYPKAQARQNPESSKVTVHNYWEDAPVVSIEDQSVKWLALEREESPSGILLLQNYSTETVSTRVNFTGRKRYMDVESRDMLLADDKGSVEIKLPANYGTRMFLVTRAEEPQPQPPPANVLLSDDFESGISFAWRPLPRQGALQVVRDRDVGRETNHVLRMSQNKELQSLELEENRVPASGDYQLSFRFRVPELPKGANGIGFLRIIYRSTKQTNYNFVLDISATDKQASWAFSRPTCTREGQAVPFTDITTDLTALPFGQGPLRQELGEANAEWHTLSLRLEGPMQTLMLDDKVVFAGKSDVSLGGGLRIGTGGGMSSDTPRVPYVEIDDVKIIPLTIGR